MVDFIIIGAMKCATSTLYQQLQAQSGIFMATPKEPCFFSNDEVWDKGSSWYKSLFQDAPTDHLKGEASTHYTKLPTYPSTLNRMSQLLPQVKLIYIMRHPIERLISQYIHQWTEREISADIEEAINSHKELISYSLYHKQLSPFLDLYGSDNVLPIFLPYFRRHPQKALEHICQFIGYQGSPIWQKEQDGQNRSSQRLRQNDLRDRIVYAPIISHIRQYLVPQQIRDAIKQNWQMTKRPTLSRTTKQHLTDLFNADLQKLSTRLPLTLTCQNFDEVTAQQPINWCDNSKLTALT